jgi:3-isopropylmalate/(R)-2-methylmalate dehydratase small subunit
MKFDLNRVIRGRVWKFGDSIDTDSINPYYKYQTMEEIKQHTLESFRPEFPKNVQPGDIIVAGRNFGCGSHRPATVLREVGVAAILVESASRLFLRNTIALPMPIYVVPGINEIVGDGETLEIDYAQRRATNAATGASVDLPKFPPMIEQIYACGGLPQLARERYLAEQH